MWILIEFDPVVTVSRIFPSGSEIIEGNNLVAIQLCHNWVISIFRSQSARHEGWDQSAGSPKGFRHDLAGSRIAAGFRTGLRIEGNNPQTHDAGLEFHPADPIE